ncbi:hypothetical protein EVAR_12965_1 [Eumeta japonica]|uniref:Uncharacterized protein n=1 Tax=Eumeta variegata TaxID=151549 RepID=A0A4C1TX91_EUMVA|nr:hypothetical protein EVAR_12965_1 [Eumeta japonica]
MILLEIAFFVLTFDRNCERLSNRQCTGRMLRSREDTRPFCRLEGENETHCFNTSAADLAYLSELEAQTNVILLMHLKRACHQRHLARLTPFCRERDERVANA